MKIRSLKGIDTKDIAEVFNTSFADYFIPFKLTEEQIISKMWADKIDLRLSVGAFKNGKLVAFILHGFDTIGSEKVVYNAGTGVVPQERGQGLSQQMYRFILPILVQKGIHKVVLEVITKNVPAIKSYEKSGFKLSRKLYCYKGEVSSVKAHETVTVKVLEHYAWEQLEAFWDTQPTWQNSKNVLERITGNAVLGAYAKNQIVGYISFNPTHHRIQQLAVQKEFRNKGIASRLVWELKEHYGKAMTVINVDEKDEAMNAFLLSIGLNNHLAQYEMEMALP